MRKYVLIFTLAVLAFSVFAIAGDHAYVGPNKCKMCHRVEYNSWAKTKHATAWDALKPAEQKDAKCNVCHSTDLPKLTGVSCEACHGAGGDYWKMSIMKDKAKAIANGLVMPTKEVCVRCHNSKSPTFKGFDFDKMKTKVHEFKNDPFK